MLETRLVTEKPMVTRESIMRYPAPFHPQDNKPLELKYRRKAGLSTLKAITRPIYKLMIDRYYFV